MHPTFMCLDLYARDIVFSCLILNCSIIVQADLDTQKSLQPEVSPPL
jgi:hypothetical protein